MEYSPKNTSVSVSPSGEILEGSSVTLTCNNKANPPVYRYTWFKNGAENSQSGSQKNYYTITNIRSEDSGKYRCVARNTHGTGTSELYSVDVQYSPKNTLVSISPSGDILEGSLVTLTCNSKANPAVDTYSWFKNGAEISQRGSMQDYDITNITSEDSGEYYCVATNTRGTGTSGVYTVNVLYSPKDTLVSISPSGDIVEGSLVTLTCNSKANPPVDTYAWFKNGAEISQRGSRQNYNISIIRSEDSGEYHCEASNKVGTQKSNTVIFNIHGNQSGNRSVVMWTVGGTAGALVLAALIAVVWKRSATNGSEGQKDDGVYSDPVNDTYTSLDMKTLDSDYDTLKTVRGTASKTNPEK
ncbi:B-cell receptor CD22-like [Scleropages formosus]|uniref:B-cell receptor CD22-like n=1 Tax=Scleropages formosus TaxID=113540 RepID=UPI0010FABFB2|nr:B-cell receptor CD22-like [Scleropages formosus]